MKAPEVNMSLEIEYKFLVDKTKWEALEKPEPKAIVQAYLQREKDRTVRVRTKGDRGFLTMKGATTGVTRAEFEYEIPAEEVHEIIETFQLTSLEKKRYEIAHEGHLWEVDVFEGKLAGLILAEIELQSETEVFALPDWVTEDVSSDPQYYNSQLVSKCE